MADHTSQRRALIDACETFELWLRLADTGPVFPAGVSRDSAEGENIALRWSIGHQRLGTLARKQARDALRKVRET